MPSRRIEAVAFIVGAASLGTEIAAARLLAPWFGASTIIWANTIATVLVALAIGYWFGGRLADRDPSLQGLSRLVLLAAGLLAVVPFVAGPFLRDLGGRAGLRRRRARSRARCWRCSCSSPCRCSCWAWRRPTRCA